jgi:hypothetical protein
MTTPRQTKRERELLAKIEALERDLSRERRARIMIDAALLQAMRGSSVLYDAARDITHQCGFPWTDPRTGAVYDPPKKAKR